MLKDISQIRPTFDPPFILKTFLTGLLIILVAAILILCWVPPVSRDALTHHLALPKLYLAHGGIYEIPAISFSYYPLNLDLLYLIALYFRSDIAPKFIHFSFALLCAGLIYGYLKRRLDTLWGLAGALMFLSLPVIVKLSFTVYVDLGLIFFSTASLLFLIHWIEDRYRLKYLVLSAVFCGLALGTKYNGLVILFLLALFAPFVYLRSQANTGTMDGQRPDTKSPLKFTKALGYMAVFIFISLLIYSPWAIRNVIWTNNPVYPLYNSWFNPQEKTMAVDDGDKSQDTASPASGRKRKPLSPFLKRKLLYKETFWQSMAVPVRIFFQGKDDDPQLFDGKLNPYLLILSCFAFLGIKKDLPFLKTEKFILLTFSVLYLMFAFFTVDMRMRYVAPIIPPLVMLAVLGLRTIVTYSMEKFSPVIARVSIGTTLAVLLCLFMINTAYIYRQFQIVDPFSYLRGRLDRHAYIEKYRPEYPVIQYANTHLSENDKILALFLGKRRYYSDREIIFKVGLFRRAVKNAQSANEIVADLKQSGITYLIIRFDIFKPWSKAVFDIRQKEMLRTFYDSNLSLIFTKGGYGLYQLNEGIN
jgi:hypothetical protein